MAGREEGRRSNGQLSSGQGNANNANNGDLYKQLRDNNDMVKELDDIEAISQQISQHAEVLYNSWKSNGLSHSGGGSPGSGPQQFKVGPGQGNSGFADSAGRNAVNGRQYHSLRTDRDGRVLNREELAAEHNNSGLQGGGYHSLERSRVASSDSSSSPRHSTVSSPSSSTRESPQRGSSITHISHNAAPDVGPLELLASPNLNGNLEDLVSSFVSTDRAKQAARNTISSTIRRRLGGSPNGSSSPVRSPSPTSPLGFKNSSSPLRSPMMTNMASPSPPSDPQTSPRSPTSMFNQSESTNRVAVGFLQSSDIHAPMQSIFGKNSPKPSPSSPLQVHTAASPQSPSRPAGSLQNLPAKTSPLHIQTAKTEDSIPIPVKHIPIAISQNPNPAPQTSQPAHGLKSPSVLQHVNNVAPKSPFQFPNRPAGEGMEKMPNFFDEFGAPKDPETSIMQMRKRMEEAKQRMALSLPAREGGVRPNSFTAMGSRNLFDGSPWGDDPSAFLLEQFRRRNKRRMEVPAAPHPELTPQQKQHISDRSEQGMSGSMSSIQQLPRRLLPNGSVAERVLMFEKSPSMFGDVRVPPQRKEPQLTGTSITSTPWRASAQDLQVGF